jgi:putative Holliday junction resolvase
MPNPRKSPLIPAHGRLAGIDYGTVRIGIAVCDDERVVASPFDTYTRRNPDADAAFFREFVEQERIVGFVVGLPVHSSGSESVKSQEVRRFGEWLAAATDRPVQYWDERYTTVAAEQLLNQASIRGRKRKTRLDRVAAQIILATFIEVGHEATPQPLDDNPPKSG